MSFARVNPGGWGLFEVFTSSEANQLDINTSRAIDGFNGGTYAPSTPIDIGGAGITISVVAGDPTFTGSPTFEGSTTFNAAITVNAAATFNGATTFTGGAFFQSGLQISGGGLSITTGADPFVISVGGTFEGGPITFEDITVNFGGSSGQLVIQAGAELHVDGSIGIYTGATLAIFGNGTLNVASGGYFIASGGAHIDFQSTDVKFTSTTLPTFEHGLNLGMDTGATGKGGGQIVKRVNTAGALYQEWFHIVEDETTTKEPYHAIVERGSGRMSFAANARYDGAGGSWSSDNSSYYSVWTALPWSQSTVAASLTIYGIRPTGSSWTSWVGDSNSVGYVALGFSQTAGAAYALPALRFYPTETTDATLHPNPNTLYAESVPKAWGRCGMVSGTPAYNSTFNVKQITLDGTDMVVEFWEPMSTDDYVVVVTDGFSTQKATAYSRTASTFKVRCIELDGTETIVDAGSDTVLIDFVAFGRQDN